ncbi:MAG: hypothetical protein WBH57_13960 [Anaerolineae bacterium]
MFFCLSPEPPEALGELPSIGIAIPRELLNGKASGGVEDSTPVRMERVLLFAVD